MKGVKSGLQAKLFTCILIHHIDIEKIRKVACKSLQKLSFFLHLFSTASGYPAFSTAELNVI